MISLTKNQIRQAVYELKKEEHYDFYLHGTRLGRFIASYVGKNAVNVTLVPSKETRERFKEKGLVLKFIPSKTLLRELKKE